MEVTLDCQTATISILDSNYAEIVTFDNVRVLGNTGLCSLAANANVNAPRHGFVKKSTLESKN